MQAPIPEGSPGGAEEEGLRARRGAEVSGAGSTGEQTRGEGERRRWEELAVRMAEQETVGKDREKQRKRILKNFKPE